MRYHAKKSLTNLLLLIPMVALLGYTLYKHYPQDGLLLKDVGPYYSQYVLALLAIIILLRLLTSLLFRLIYYKARESEPWKKAEADKLVEYAAIQNIFLFFVIGLMVALALLYLKLPLTLFFLVLALTIFGCECVYLISVWMYQRNLSDE